MDEGSDNEVTPEVSGLFSWANDGETFGVSAFASYQERKSSIRGVSVEQFQFFDYSPGPVFPVSREGGQCAGRLVRSWPFRRTSA